MSTAELLEKLSKGEITVAEAQSQLVQQGQRAIVVRGNAESRVISVYGLGRMPVSLYRSQWERLGLSADSPVSVFIAKYGEYLPADKGDKCKDIPKNMIGDGKPFRFVEKRES